MLSLQFFFWMGTGREVVHKAEIKANTAVARFGPELDEIRCGGKASGGRSVADISDLRVSNQATSAMLLTGSSGPVRRAERARKVSFAWLRRRLSLHIFVC